MLGAESAPIATAQAAAIATIRHRAARSRPPPKVFDMPQPWQNLCRREAPGLRDTQSRQDHEKRDASAGTAQLIGSDYLYDAAARGQLLSQPAMFSEVGLRDKRAISNQVFPSRC